MSTERLKRLMIAACGVLLAGISPVGALAQDDGRGAAGGRTGAPVAQTSSSAARTARELTRLASMDLQLTGGVSPRDFRVASLLMEIAHRLSPNDEIVLRLLIDAASASGDQETMMAMTGDLLRLDRRDTVSQLRVISGGISSKQDIDGRLEMYRSFLGERGAALNIDNSVLSRLALDAALLLRERGDMRGFADMLAKAAELDSTNKDAASLAVSFFSAQSADPVGRVTLLVSLLKADLFDAETHLELARQLAAGEAFEQSNRFYQTYQVLLKIRGAEPPLSITAESNTLFWSSQGADKLVAELRDRVESERAAADQRRRFAISTDRALDASMDRDLVRLTPEIECVRMAAALASGDQGQTDYAYDELVRTFEMQIGIASSRGELPPGVTAASMLEREQRLRGELMSMRLLTGRDLDAAAATLDELRQDPTLTGVAGSAGVLNRLTGWLQLQKGELDAAEQTLKPMADTDVVARLGLCVLEERRERTDEAVKEYESLARDAAGTMAGAYARTRYKVLTGSDLPRLPMTLELEALGAGVPTWMEEMIVDPRRIVSLQATLDVPVIGALDPAMVRVKIRNVSPIPLAVGPERPVNSRLMLAPELMVEMKRLRDAYAGAVIVRLDRRLRLLPHEEIEVAVWADQGNMGWIMNRLITRSLSVKWKVIQGFMMHPEGYYVPGPQCVSVESPQLDRTPTRKLLDTPESLARWLESGSAEDIAEVLMLAAINAEAPPDSPSVWSPEERARIAGTLAARYPKLDPASRVMVATMTPSPRHGAWLKPVEDAIAADTDSDVRAVALALRVSDPNDPRLAAAEASGEARLVLLAALIRDRLAEGITTFATVRGRSEVEGQQPPPAGGPPGGGQ